jgi:hypothetical protein
MTHVGLEFAALGAVQGAVRGMIAREAKRGIVHVAVIGAADGVRLVAVGRTRDALLRRVAEYVERRVDLELPEEEAARIRRQLASGEIEAAVHGYFACDARRWDEEWLHLTTAREPRARARGAVASAA